VHKKYSTKMGSSALIYIYKVGLSDLNAVCISLLINFKIPETVFIILGIYIEIA
jgi:hypothetical protein